MLRYNFDNDFKFTVQPKLNDELIDLSELEDLKLSIRNSFRSANFEPIWEITDVGIEIEVQKEMIKWTGVYTVYLTYRRPDGSYSDFFQDKRIGCPTFQIVDVGCETSEDGEVITINVSPEYKGDKGDPFTYDDFTPEQIEELQRPATDAGEAVRLVMQEFSEFDEQAKQNEQERTDDEALRRDAENTRSQSETQREQNETFRVNAEQGRVSAEDTRVENENERIEGVNSLYENITDLSELPTFDITKKQMLVHEYGTLKWMEYE